MKKIYLIPALLVAALPAFASAHQVAIYSIGGATYQFVVGSLNEPIAVDDKTGVDLTVTKGSGGHTMSADGDMDGMPSASTPVTGLESTLKVELIAGSQRKALALSPVYGKSGSYSAAFYPTVATTIAYRFTGTIGSTPVDVTFTCLPEGAPRAPEDTTHVKVSDGVTRISNSGGFGCPKEKEGLGFPENSASVMSLKESGGTARSTTYAALALSAAALGIAVSALARKRQ